MSSDRAQTSAASVSSELFRQACGRFPTGVAIAAIAGSDGAPHGLTVSSFTSLSLDPPLVLICLGHAVTLIDHFRTAEHFGLSVLREDQRPISERFARRGQNRFTGVPWHSGEFHVPLINGSLAAIECAVDRRIAAGDHDILIGRVLRAHVSEGRPLVHWAGKYGRLEE
ncbi:MAG: flavin reductase family protein [Bryobacteraceae bacterium]|jgi:flavin reductase (DIM6/NTAB) family NADH-FMN oxidoreductase RutF